MTNVYEVVQLHNIFMSNSRHSTYCTISLFILCLSALYLSRSVPSDGSNKNRDDRIRTDSARSYCDSHCLQLKVLTRAVEVRSHLAGMLKRFAPKGTPFASCGDDDVTVRKCLISGYFANAAKLASTGDYLTVRGNTSVSIHTHSVIARYARMHARTHCA
jgi:hypothetical protein